MARMWRMPYSSQGGKASGSIEERYKVAGPGLQSGCKMSKAGIGVWRSEGKGVCRIGLDEGIGGDAR